MKIVFKSENGFCPMWEHNGIRYFLYEDYDGSWTLKSKKLGYKKKSRFYRSDNGLHCVHPITLLERYFKRKSNVRYEKKGYYHFWYWQGKVFITNGIEIVIQYQEKYERPSFGTYLECLKDAKEYLQEKYSDGQLVLQLN